MYGFLSGDFFSSTIFSSEFLSSNLQRQKYKSPPCMSRGGLKKANLSHSRHFIPEDCELSFIIKDNWTLIPLHISHFLLQLTNLKFQEQSVKHNTKGGGTLRSSLKSWVIVLCPTILLVAMVWYWLFRFFFHFKWASYRKKCGRVVHALSQCLCNDLRGVKICGKSVYRQKNLWKTGLQAEKNTPCNYYSRKVIHQS